MATRFLRCLVLMLAVTPCTISAVTVVQCRDRDGNISFRDRCPPDIAKTGERAVSNPAAHNNQSLNPEAQRKNPITLYSASECDYCDLVRLRLRDQSIPFKEVDVTSDVTRQKELKEVSGALTVPTIVIGKNILSGYKQAALDSGLEQAGYLPPNKNAAKKTP